MLLTSCAVNAKRLLEVEASKVESFETALKKNISCVLEAFYSEFFFERKDVLAVLPTNSGKSLLLQLYTVYSWPVCTT